MAVQMWHRQCCDAYKTNTQWPTSGSIIDNWWDVMITSQNFQNYWYLFLYSFAEWLRRGVSSMEGIVCWTFVLVLSVSLHTLTLKMRMKVWQTIPSVDLFLCTFLATDLLKAILTVHSCNMFTLFLFIVKFFTLIFEKTNFLLEIQSRLSKSFIYPLHRLSFVT